jgi:pimeloyl-ACP methyl ester carboxylesterase
LSSAAKADAGGARAIADDMIPVLLGSTTRKSRPSIIERVRTMIDATSPVGIAGAQRGMAERLDSTHLLPSIHLPVLVIVGAEDTLTPIAEAESLQENIRGARLRVIQAAGHLSNMENPEDFNKEIVEFLKSLSYKTPAQIGLEL